MKKLFLATLLISTFTSIGYAQNTEDDNRTFGFTASLQTDQLDFLVPIWVSEQMTIAPTVSVVSAKEVGSDITIGVQPKFYTSKPEKAALFIAVKGGVVIGIPDEGDNIYDFIAGAGVGGEYFLDKNFSFGIELQGNFTISDEGSFRFGNPGNVNFNTATAITASIYF